MQEFCPHISIEELPEILSVEELGHILRISRSGAYELARSSDLKVLRVGKRVLIPKKNLMMWIQQHCE